MFWRAATLQPPQLVATKGEEGANSVTTRAGLRLGLRPGLRRLSPPGAAADAIPQTRPTSWQVCSPCPALKVQVVWPTDQPSCLLLALPARSAGH